MQFSVEHIPGSYAHNDSYEAQHPYNANAAYPPGDYAISPEDHHDAYHNQPYQPVITPLEEVYGPPSGEQHPHYWQDEVDTHPILQPDSAYGPDPHQIPTPVHEEQMEMNAEPQSGGGIRRWKTVKEVQLFNGNLALRLTDCVVHAKDPLVLHYRSICSERSSKAEVFPFE